MRIEITPYSLPTLLVQAENAADLFNDWAVFNRHIGSPESYAGVFDRVMQTSFRHAHRLRAGFEATALLRKHIPTATT